MKKILWPLMAFIIVFLLISLTAFSPCGAELETIICLDREYNFLGKREYTSVVSSSDHTAMIRSDGSLWMFGGNCSGQLGIGKLRYSYNAPVKVLEGVHKAVVNDDITLAIKKDGSVWGFGKNLSSTPEKILGYAKDASMDGMNIAYIDKEENVNFKQVKAFSATKIAKDAEAVILEFNDAKGKGFAGQAQVTENPPEFFIIVKHKDGTAVQYARDKFGDITETTLAENVKEISLNASTVAYLTIIKNDGTVLYGNAIDGLSTCSVQGCVRALASPMGLFVQKTDGTVWNITKGKKLGSNVKLFSVPHARAAFMCHNDGTVSVGSLSRSEVDAFNAINYAVVQVKKPKMYEDIYKKTLEIVGNEKDKYLQTKLVCQWIADHVTYEESPHDQSGVEAFRQGTGVCTAYAELARIMLGYLDIPIRMVTGEGHAWNLAVIDGVAVFIDITNADYQPLGYLFDYPALTSAQTCNSAVYREVPFDQWAANDVRGAYDHNLIDVTISNGFKKPIKRAEFCSLIRAVIEQKTKKDINEAVSSLGKSSVACFFTDTKNEDVIALYRLGIINGTSAKTFAPDHGLTRQQAAKILCELAKILGLNAEVPKSAETKLSGFPDNSDIDAWAVPGVLFVTHNNIMNGKTTGFAPKDMLTAQEAIAICFRYFSAINE